jgi:predicted MPP superfamily phosphohydrolase
MEVLAKYFRNENIKVLLEIKRAGKENEPLSVLDSGDLDNDIAEQFEKLDTAYLESDLPEKPDPDILQDIEKYLIDLRLSGLGL